MFSISLLVAISTIFSLPSNAEEENCLSIQACTESDVFLPFKPALPSNFVSGPLFPDKEIGLIDGIIWSTQENIEDIWNHYKKNHDFNILSSAGLIRARLSLRLNQDSPGILAINESIIRTECRKLGARRVRFKQLKWGNYPVTVIEVRFATRKPMAIAWMGLNVGPILFIDYIFPDNKTSYKKDWDIWHHFLQNTIAIPFEDLM